MYNFLFSVCAPLYGNISQSYLFPSSKIGKRQQRRAIRYILQKDMYLANLDGFSAQRLKHRFEYVKARQENLQEDKDYACRFFTSEQESMVVFVTRRQLA